MLTLPKTDFFELYDINGNLLIPSLTERASRENEFAFSDGLSNKTKMDLLEKPDPEIHLYGIVNESMANFVGRALEYLTAERQCPELKVMINSTGGSAIAGTRIHNLFSDYPGGVHGYVEGYAYSAAAQAILQGCLIRYAYKHSRLLVHYAHTLIYAGEQELMDKEKMDEILKSMNISDEQTIEILMRRIEMQRILKGVKEFNDESVDILMERTGKNESDVRELLSKGNVMTAKDAKEIGIIDITYAKKLFKITDAQGALRFKSATIIGQ